MLASSTLDPINPLPLHTLAHVIVPLAVRARFTYRLSPEQALAAAVGMRVLVPFGKRKIYTGIIRAIEQVPPTKLDHRLKPVAEILDKTPILTLDHLELMEWMAFYYACSPGEVLKAALPVGLKPESALRVKARDEHGWPERDLSDKEFVLMEALSIQPVLDFKEVSELWQVLNPTPRLRDMETRGLISLYQQVEETYKPKTEIYLHLAEAYRTEAALHEAFDSLSRAPKQENLFMYLVSEYHQGRAVPRKETLKRLDLGNSIAKALVDKGLVREETVQVDRLDLHGYPQSPPQVTLNPKQARALQEIQAALAENPQRPVLLHGITGSGKTHIYIELIKEALEKGQQVLYLLPEITLTKQIIDRVQSNLGVPVGVYHSRFSDNERVEIWHKVRQGLYPVVIGVRSAIFLPFKELGLIVVDEEHDSSFKQHEPAPRYHARDVAIYYGYQHRCPVVLGSATPAFETYLNAEQGKYAYVGLSQRAIEAKLPEIQVVDMRMMRKQQLLNGVFSRVLEDAIIDTLERGEQVILFQNRRGFSPYLICDTCGHVPECVNCDISLTFHKAREHLRCHYCGYTEFTTHQCGNCGNYTMRRAGIGTERIEEEVAALFPNHRVQRMDLDTTRGKHSYQQLIQQFEAGHIDILVGTQMVSKGLDFENVTLVGVVNADNLLTFPDFRAYERAYQLLTQVSGRAGRRQKQGRVVIQTMMPDNPVLKALEKDFEPFFRSQLPERQAVGYPPFTRLLRIDLRHKDRDFILAESTRMLNLLRPVFGQNLLGPDFALVPRVRNEYRMQFLVKISKATATPYLRERLEEVVDRYYAAAPKKSLRILFDVDPQ